MVTFKWLRNSRHSKALKAYLSIGNKVILAPEGLPFCPLFTARETGSPRPLSHSLCIQRRLRD